MLPAQPFAQLRSTPAGVLLLELDDGLLDLKGELAGMPVGPSGAIRQAIQPTVLVTTEDLVAGLAGDPELLAQHRHLLPVEPTGHKRSEEHTSELQSRVDLVCRLLLEKKNT